MNKHNLIVKFYNSDELGEIRAISNEIPVGGGFIIEFSMTCKPVGPLNMSCEWTPAPPQTRQERRSVQKRYQRARGMFLQAVAARTGKAAAVIDMDPSGVVRTEVTEPPILAMQTPNGMKKVQCVICRGPGRHLVQFQDDDSRNRLNAISPDGADAFFMLCERCRNSLVTKDGRETIGEKLIEMVAECSRAETVL